MQLVKPPKRFLDFLYNIPESRKNLNNNFRIEKNPEILQMF